MNRNASHPWSLLATLAAVLAGVAPAAGAPSRPAVETTFSIGGEWAVKLDPQDRGVQEELFKRDFYYRLQLPGSLQAQRYGNELRIDTPWTGEVKDKSWWSEPRYEPYRQPGNVKLPFWLTPDRHYVGPAWYQRDIRIPNEWKAKRITLSLERCHWETSVWVDGQPVGSADSLSVPHVYDLTKLLAPGRHRITLRVDNRLKVGVGINAHSVSDHTQGNWNGVVGELKLSATDLVYIDDVQVHPELGNRSARVTVTLVNQTPRRLAVDLTLKAASTNTLARHRPPPFRGRVDLAPGLATVEIHYPLSERLLTWDEFSPALYDLEVALETSSSIWSYSDVRRTTFGMRQVGVSGTQVTINGRKTYLRGTLECCIFPLTGYPPTDVESWRRIIRIAKAHGLNHIRFHSWCPPKAAFVAADELGFYYQVECAAWSNSGASIGDGQPIDTWLYTEGDRILREYGNHPSFLLLAYGNEPAGRRQQEYLGRLVNYWKGKDARRLYTSGAGWPLIAESDYHSTPAPRIQQWGEGLQSRINARPPETTTDYREFVAKHSKPVVSHEIGQWCVYPNFDEIAKYTGCYRAGNLEIFRDHLRERGMSDQARAFLMASGKLQALCYKEEIESALRTPGFGGFQLLDLHDFPGQGTALVGVLDPFWDSKGYISAREYSRFCNSTVPLARLAKRVWTSDETLTAAVEIAHFGPAELKDAKVYWKLLDSRGKTRATGDLGMQTIPVGNGTALGQVTAPLSEYEQAAQLKLVVGLEKTRFENDWDVWVYPPSVDVAPGTNVLVAEALDDAVLRHLEAGGKALLMPAPARVATDVRLGFSPIFWNTAWTDRQPPHTLGILCRPDHAALTAFPTESHSNWQWWDLVQSGAATVMDDLPLDLRPIVQVIDDWVTNHRLGLVFEARIGKGSLLYCSMDLRSNLAQRPVARQMLHSLLRYMDGRAFNPQYELTPGHLARLVKPAPAP